MSLNNTTSPYLSSHKDNPVQWRSWGPEALAEAKAADKPILLTLGYVGCHWCHVHEPGKLLRPRSRGLHQ